MDSPRPRGQRGGCWFAGTCPPRCSAFSFSVSDKTEPQTHWVIGCPAVNRELTLTGMSSHPSLVALRLTADAPPGSASHTLSHAWSLGGQDSVPALTDEAWETSNIVFVQLFKI